MWFDLGAPSATAFWMKGMRFPLDMVWVDEQLRVVQVTHEAPVPPPGADTQSLPVYSHGATPVRYVLEIGAGLARELAIQPGVQVQVQPLPPGGGS